MGDEVAIASKIDRAEAYLMSRGAKPAGLGESPDVCHITHRFTPGLYIRECRMDQGAIVISKIHKTEHPFVISKGAVIVFNQADGTREILRASHIGITKPGARRVIAVLEECIWTTFHPTDKTDPVEIERDIIEPHRNALLDQGDV
jgi:hypothetical protein